MKKIYVFLFLLFVIRHASAQTHEDTIRLLQQTAALYDLDFTTAEADSMMDNIRQYNNTYKAMHKTLPVNSLAYPFAFVPAPPGTVINTQKKKIDWNIPQNVSMPKDKNDLA